METFLRLSFPPRHVSTPRGGSFVMSATKSAAERRTPPVLVGAAPPGCGRSSSSTFGSGFRAAAAGHAHCCLCRRAPLDGKQLLFLDRFGPCRSRAFPSVPDGCLSVCQMRRAPRGSLCLWSTPCHYITGALFIYHRAAAALAGLIQRNRRSNSGRFFSAAWYPPLLGGNGCFCPDGLRRNLLLG